MEGLSNDIVTHINNEGVGYIQFKKLLEYPEIEHCYTTRKNNLNFKTTDGDVILQESYRKICDALEFDKNNIVKPHQTHTANVECVNSTSDTFNQVDGVITNKSKIILCTTSADCTSLLIYDPVKKVIGDIHSGWRGTLKKIGQEAIKKMVQNYGSNPSDIICCIGPHIRKCHFEVEEDVMQMFKDKFEYAFKPDEIISVGYKKEGVQKYYIDTTLINKFMLEEQGIKKENIFDSGICTVCESHNFHSHRTDGENSGRNAAMIMLK